jgi:hypothetical protein
MGNFYTNYTVRRASQQEVASALAGRAAMVTPESNGCVVVFDEQSDEQDPTKIAELASGLSRDLSCAVLAVLNHDDDVLRYQLYEKGELTDEYDSSPGYFDPAGKPSSPAGGDPQRLCSAFGASDMIAVGRVLRKSALDKDGYVFAIQRHFDLVRALGIPSFGVGTSYGGFEYDEYPEGLSPDDLVRTE